MNDPWTERLELKRFGHGEELVFLHGEDGLLFCEDLISALAEKFTVCCPIAPGWSDYDLSFQQRSISDLSYLYLDMFEANFEAPVPVVGVSLGAWLALEIGVKRRDVISRLGLVSPVGVGVRQDRGLDFVDIYAISPAALDSALYSRRGVRTRSDRALNLNEGELLQLARAEQSVAYYCWEPYFRNPQLAGLLHRIQRPACIIYGVEDRFVADPEYYAKLGVLLADSTQNHAVEEAGHRVEEEAPDAVADYLLRFLAAGEEA
jgi:pimeloyl-ACP methyl ester carboxylesterase